MKARVNTGVMSLLSPRLQLIYDHLLPGEPVWDFCCDHGYMGLHAYKSGLFPRVIFVDQVQEIIDNLKKKFAREFFDEESPVQVSFLAEAGEALTVSCPGTIVIAGVGAHSTAKIVRGLKDRGHLICRRLIICPQNSDVVIEHLIHEINQIGFILCNEKPQVLERGRVRKLLIFDKN